MRLFTLWISAGKWLFLLWPNFGPLNCLDCINKHLETSLHIPTALPGPKNNQFWSIGTVLSPINGHIQHWKLPKKWDFLLFSQFFPLFWAQWTSKPVKTNQCIKIPYWGYLKHHFGSFGTWNWPYLVLKTSWKIKKYDFSHDFSHFFVLNGPVIICKRTWTLKTYWRVPVAPFLVIWNASMQKSIIPKSIIPKMYTSENL